MTSQPAPSRTLQDFVAATTERDRPGDVFELESLRMLEVHVKGRMWAKLGSMVAYRGQLRFVREGALEGGLGRALKKLVSGEAAPLVKIEGQGIAYLADRGKHVTVLRLQGETLNVNGSDLLAFEDSIRYDITVHRRVAGMLAGGLFSIRLSGDGLVAIMSHGEPLTLRCSAADPLTTDPNATVAWSGGLSPDIKTDISLRSFLGRGGGEAFQMSFAGDGFVVVQPYEEGAAAPSR
ncbi:MAG TPA: AIM24 family protein [Vicinamibacteria bacterium]|nr:AIM24 family protein [Vicinamibacteria bacterium]